MRFVRFLDGNTPRYGVVDGTEVEVVSPHPFVGSMRRTGTRVPLAGLRLLAPVIPSKIIGVGRNYRDHAAELDHGVPTEPLLFLKPSSAVVGPDDAIRYPTGMTNEVHHEAELAVVIGALTQAVSPELAGANMGQPGAVIRGFTAANDVTARDLQRADDQWTRAKGFDSFLPLGPAISTDVDPAALSVRCRVNGEVRQDDTTASMVFDVATIVSYASHVMTLLPGDVVLTGTPAGVGPVVPGDVVEVEIEGIGILRNPVVDRELERTPRPAPNVSPN